MNSCPVEMLCNKMVCPDALCFRFLQLIKAAFNEEEYEAVKKDYKAGKIVLPKGLKKKTETLWQI